MRAYATVRGALAVVVGRELRDFGSVSVHRFGVHRGKLRVRGKLNTRHGDGEHVELGRPSARAA